MRLGILGGTFDPVHIGHLIIAQEAAAVLALDEVWFLPTGRPWMKEGSAVTDSGHRVAMLRLALECSAGFKVSTAEVDRPGLSYTVDTLTALLEGEAIGASLFFILGMDSLETLHRWKEPHRLFDMCTLVAVSRPGHVDFDRRIPGRHTPQRSGGSGLSGGAGHRHKRGRDTPAGAAGTAGNLLDSSGSGPVHPRTRTLSGG